ncbi:2-isopropylmalate synthase [Natranaerofaba carboxydovora]|nr:2-isopropylmalate synthase [Natranaerofaba carboxydovora]
MRKIQVFDTTLRDGEQTPGVSLCTEEKLELAKQLSRLGVDIIEAGFPFSSKGEFDACKAIADEVKGVTIAALSRANQKEIDLCKDVLKGAERSRIHIFVATSEVHLKYKLQKSKEEVLKMAVDSIKHARGHFDEIQFSPEDGGSGRTDPEFLHQIVEAAIDAGADVVNIPDTVGYQTTQTFYDLIKGIKENVPNADKAVISVHCHDDLGMAVANTLAGIKAGADQIETTINGLGERAGNAAMEEVVMALKTRKDYYDADTRVDTRQIYRTSRLVSKLTGIKIQAHKSVVGDNAFSHESGIHQDGILKEKSTYEIMTPDSIGLSSNTLALGKHSGRHAFKNKLDELGFNNLTEEQFQKAFDKFKDLAIRKKNLTDRDIEAIVENRIFVYPQVYQWLDFQVQSGNKSDAMAMVGLKKDNSKVIREAACGKGPVDAIYHTINRLVGETYKLLDYNIKSVTGGTDALGEVVVRLQKDEITATGRGISPDILEASGKAYIDAINKVISKRSELENGYDDGGEDFGKTCRKG